MCPAPIGSHTCVALINAGFRVIIDRRPAAVATGTVPVRGECARRFQRHAGCAREPGLCLPLRWHGRPAAQPGQRDVRGDAVVVPSPRRTDPPVPAGGEEPVEDQIAANSRAGETETRVPELGSKVSRALRTAVKPEAVPAPALKPEASKLAASPRSKRPVVVVKKMRASAIKHYTPAVPAISISPGKFCLGGTCRRF